MSADEKPIAETDWEHTVREDGTVVVRARDGREICAMTTGDYRRDLFLAGLIIGMHYKWKRE